MFEGKSPVPSTLSGSNHADSSAGELCALEWSDLVTKLAAARDLRAELARDDEDGFASFDPDFAAHVASHHEKLPVDGKRDVNPDGLVNGKGPDGIVVSAKQDDDPANRGNT